MDEEEQLKYLSKRFILIENKLGFCTEFVKELYKGNRQIIMEFRQKY